MAVSKAAPQKKIKKVKKAAKKKSVDKANRKADPSTTEDAAAAKARNPKAFVFSGRGKAKLQQARTAERDQKRMHGMLSPSSKTCVILPVLASQHSHVCMPARPYLQVTMCICTKWKHHSAMYVLPRIQLLLCHVKVPRPVTKHTLCLSAVPVVDTTPEEPPPFVVVVHGPPGVGKTTLIKNLIKHYVNQNLSEVKGPITVVSGKTRRLTFVECPQVGLAKHTTHIQSTE